MIEMSPSILSADFSRLGEHVKEALDAGAKRIHVDVMDGMFVPNITIGPLVLDSLQPVTKPSGALLEVHLMIEQPDRYLEAFAKAGAGMLIVHVETCPHLHRTIQSIRQLGVIPGVTLNPATSISTLEEILPEVEQVLVMTVNPGFGNQHFIETSLDKISRLRAMLDQRGLKDVAIEVDGGVNRDTIASIAKAGANVFVAGSAIFNDKASVSANLKELLDAAEA